MDTLFIHWNISPELFHIGPLSIRWYGLLFAGGFFVGYLIMQRFFKWENQPIQLLDRLATYMIVGTVVGARLGHILFYEPRLYLQNPWEILKIWHGGLASHGAAIGILISLWLFARKSKKPFLWAVDRIVIVTALAGCFIRLGNLMNSEIYGDVTSLPWGFIFVWAGEHLPKHPTQIYESLCYLATFFVLYSIYRKRPLSVPPGLLFGLFLIGIFSARFIIEFIKEPQVAFETTMNLNMGQWLSLPFILIGCILVYRAQKKHIKA